MGNGNYSKIRETEPRIAKKAKLMEIHLDSAYEKPEANIGLAAIKKDLATLAEYIIDNVPETEAVVGTSWLIDAIGEKFGFTKIKGHQPKESDFSSWLQFISKDGEIDQKRAEKMLATGEMPFHSVSGYIKIEDFLNRYLPDNRRGKIKLRKINQEKAAFFERLRENREKRRELWENLLQAGDNAADFLKKEEDMRVAIEKFEPEDKKDYMVFLQSMIDQKVPWDKIEEHLTPRIKEIMAKTKSIIDSEIYYDEIIEIPPKK